MGLGRIPFLVVRYAFRILSPGFPRSRDGSSVIFGSNRNGSWGLFQQRLDSTSASPISIGFETISRDSPLTPDGNWLLHVSYSKESLWFLNFLYPSETGFSPSGQLYRIPIGGGPPESVLSSILGVRCASRQNARCLVAAQTENAKALVFTEVDFLK